MKHKLLVSYPCLVLTVLPFLLFSPLKIQLNFLSTCDQHQSWLSLPAILFKIHSTMGEKVRESDTLPSIPTPQPASSYPERAAFNPNFLTQLLNFPSLSYCWCFPPSLFGLATSRAILSSVQLRFPVHYCLTVVVEDSSYTAKLSQSGCAPSPSLNQPFVNPSL